MKLNLLEIPIYYINLPEHTHNKTVIQNELSSNGFININKFVGTRNENARLGCTQSHYNLLNHLSDMDTPYIILEDDARITNFIGSIEIPDDADAVYLGNSVYGLYGGRGVNKISAEKMSEDIYRVYNMLGAHAILYLNKDYAEFIKNKVSFFLDTADHHDKLRAETMKYFNIYALNKPLFYQTGKHEKYTNFSIEECFYVDKRWSH